MIIGCAILKYSTPVDIFHYFFCNFIKYFNFCWIFFMKWLSNNDKDRIGAYRGVRLQFCLFFSSITNFGIVFCITIFCRNSLSDYYSPKKSFTTFRQIQNVTAPYLLHKDLILFLMCNKFSPEEAKG